MGYRLIVVVLPAVVLDGCSSVSHKPTETSFEERLLATIPEDIDMGYYDTRDRDLVFSRNGRVVAYEVDKDEKSFFAKRGERWCIVLDEKKSEPFDDVGEPVFTPDGPLVANTAKDAHGWRLVMGGKTGALFDEIRGGWRPANIAFSPDGTRVAYQARRGRRWFVVVDEKVGQEFDDVGRPVFSLDCAHVAYRVKIGERWSVVEGETKGPEFAFGARKKRELWWRVIKVK